MTDELGGRIMKEAFVLRSKMYSYLQDNGYVDKKKMGTRKCVIKREIKSKDYKNYLKHNKKMLISQQKFKSEVHNLFTEKV